MNTLCTKMANRALPKTSQNTHQPITMGLTIHPPLAAPGCGPFPSEFECGGEDRPFHVDVETQIEAAARCIVKVQAAVTQVKVDPRGRGVVDRAYQLPVAMRADTKAADIAIAGKSEPAGQK